MTSHPVTILALIHDPDLLPVRLEQWQRVLTHADDDLQLFIELNNIQALSVCDLGNGDDQFWFSTLLIDNVIVRLNNNSLSYLLPTVAKMEKDLRVLNLKQYCELINTERQLRKFNFDFLKASVLPPGFVYPGWKDPGLEEPLVWTGDV